MNFKTTIVLFVLLAIVGGIVLLTNNKTEPAPNKIDLSGRKLFDIKPDRINRVEITAASGTRTRLIKENGKWKLTDPIKAEAIEYTATDLATRLADLHSTGRPEIDYAATGLDKPSYQVELGTDDGGVTKFKLGSLAGLDNMYAQVAGSSDIDLVSASLEKTLKSAALDVRDKHLTNLTTSDIRQFRISDGKTTIECSKAGGKWIILSPDRMLGDESSIGSLLYSITGLEAGEFVKADSPDLAMSPFSRPRLTVWISTAVPSTQPDAGTSPTAGETITFGMPESAAPDARFFVQTSGGVTAKVDKAAMEALKKTELDLRDKDVVAIKPAEVTRISILKETFAPRTPATQPATEPSTQSGVSTRPSIAEAPTATRTIVLVKRKIHKELGPPMPTTQPSTEPTTKPSMPSGSNVATTDSVWQIEGDDTTQVNDASVTALLLKFGPLQAEKFVESPRTDATERFSVEITAQPPGQAPMTHHIDLVTGPGAKAPLATYTGVNFEVAKALVDALNAEFVKK